MHTSAQSFKLITCCEDFAHALVVSPITSRLPLSDDHGKTDQRVLHSLWMAVS